MNPRVFVRTGGLMMLLSGLLYFGTMTTNLMGLSRVGYAWLGLAATALLVPAMWGIYQYLKAKNNELQLQFGVIMMWAGVPFLIGIYLQAYFSEVISNSAYWIAATDPALIDMIQSSLDVMAITTIVIGSTLTFGVAPLWIGIASLRAGWVPRWMGWLAVIGGALGHVWIGFGWTDLPVPLFIPSAVLIVVWMLIIGIKMIRAKDIPAV